ncbi:uncharacterized protein SPPG_08974 [Spizellomyces punctatus DAOM BR117]|uniref:Uncharacterized protein n=1 Tax=Spizellomyces punctatus (strain DAOM BR117) TaxID=645134 RepID=A0A0L0HPD9_SPIPD|nr:uncharacterized protein SPPG_08974 [Spizellomyces punctatus DAOM BR117]KND02957.1 hypothetical protein SPPG_08974 [Spizellomyces punctatus DAOM BR117]|eukprot:XP_016610996.1 hypothetical protein SPPG_08974 [Spizellomyces punctatus DAOM BR117]
MSLQEESYIKLNPTVLAPEPCGRVRRIGNNSRNTSDLVFKFGGVMDDKHRYETDVATAEKLRQKDSEEKKARRIQVKRNWLSDLETARWDRMAAETERIETLREQKRATTRVGKNSSGYNPITLHYLNSPEGTILAAEDARAMYKTGARATKLYFKNNTFDPLRCEDIVPNPPVKPKQKPRDITDAIRHIVPLAPSAFREGAETAIANIAGDRSVAGGRVKQGGRRRGGY